jgi:hypothetical protein
MNNSCVGDVAVELCSGYTVRDQRWKVVGHRYGLIRNELSGSYNGEKR